MRTTSCSRTGYPAILEKVLLDFEDVDKFCTRSFHLEDAEVFGSQKRKPDIPIGADDETNRPDIFNFSCPSLAQRTTSSHASPLPTIVEESSPSVLEVPPPPPTGLDFCRVIAVQVSEVDEKLWNIACVPYNSSKACCAMHAVTRKKCTAKIVSNSKSTPTTAYLRLWNYYKFTAPKLEKFFFVPTSLSVVSKVHDASE